MTSIAELPKPERLRLALEEFYARSRRQRHPEGEWRNGLWYPSELECRSCCKAIQPTAANRQALEGHCRTQTHVAEIFEVKVGELKAAVRDDRKRGSPIAERVLSSFVAPPLCRFETFDEFRRRSRREAFERIHGAVTRCQPLLEQLRACTGEDQEAAVPLLENVAAGAEYLLVTIGRAVTQESTFACSGALLETLGAQLEGLKKKKGRRARSSPPKVDTL